MYFIKLRKPECRTSLTFGLCSLVTGEARPEYGGEPYSSGVFSLPGSSTLWCGKRKNLVRVDSPVLILNIIAELKGRMGEEKELIEACKIIFCCFTPRKKTKHTHPGHLPHPAKQKHQKNPPQKLA